MSQGILMRLMLTMLLLFSFEAHSFGIGRDRVHIVGSSIVSPFITRVVEQFGRHTIFASPYVESSSTGAGFNLFCRHSGQYIANIMIASRPIRASESSICGNVGELMELKIGYDALVIANSKGGANFNLSKDNIFKAAAAQVVQDGNIVSNFYENWSSIDPILPDRRIEIYGPPGGSGTRDILLDLIFLNNCMRLKEFQTTYGAYEERVEQCKKVRHDGFFIGVAENDGVIIRKLISNTNALGIVSFSFLQQNSKDIKANLFGGLMPSKKNIVSGKYNLSRPLYIYIKKNELESVIGLKDFLKEVVSEAAIAPDGYLADIGFVSLNANERKELQKIFME